MRIRFGVLDLNVEGAVLRERIRVPNLKLTLHLRARAALGDQFFVGKTRLRIAIDHPHETVRWRAIDVPIKFLHVLAVISFRAAHAENPLLQERIAFIPKCERKTEPAFVIRNAADAVLVPAIRAGARVIVRKIIPGVAVGAVILAHRAPGALGQIRPPEMPRFGVRLVFRETQLFGVHHRRLAIKNPQFARSLPAAAGNPPIDYSHSMVLGGLLEMSKQTRLTPLTSLLMRDEMRASNS